VRRGGRRSPQACFPPWTPRPGTTGGQKYTN
jgi:hypothetical protein